MSYSPPSSVSPFTLEVSEQDHADWRQLLQLSKLAPDTWEGRQEDGRYGVSTKWLSEAKEYWLHRYDWRAEEKYINSFPNYKVQIEDVDLHFVALFSEKRDAIPIVFLHGWPGSFLEFLPMCALIREQYSAKDLPYHIIVPSLPGYTLSTVQNVEKDWGLQDIAHIINKLMLGLGFDQYLAQGGDIGSLEARILSETYDACVGIHRNATGVNLILNDELPDEDSLIPAEKRSRDSILKFLKTGQAYAQAHATRPSTIGNILSSSPLALLAWIGEKFLDLSDEVPSLDTILTSISLYWFTASFPRSIYPYRQIFGTPPYKFEKIKKPTGFSSFPCEVLSGTKATVEKQCNNLVFYKEHDQGGHFAAMEQPKLFWEDIEEFVKKVWKT